MSVPPPLDLSFPAGHPGPIPHEPWPCGRHCSAYGGTPLLPGSEVSEEEYIQGKQNWARASAEYLIKLQKWIDENAESPDPKIRETARRETGMIPHRREKISPYLK